MNPTTSPNLNASFQPIHGAELAGVEGGYAGPALLFGFAAGCAFSVAIHEWGESRRSLGKALASSAAEQLQ